MTDHFRPIMLHHPTFEDKYENPSIEVTQRLAPELYDYEFPPRSRIMAIEENIQDDQDEYFDESSFTSVSTDHYYLQEEEDGEEELNDLLSFINESFTKNDFISDHQLSPLQLPCQYIRNNREESYDSTGTVQPLGPSSFLSAKHRQLFLERVPEEDRINWDETSFVFPNEDCEDWDDQVYPSVHPYHTEDTQSQNSHMILMKISKHRSPIIIHSSTASCSDEGYDDKMIDSKEMPIESASVFLPLSDDEQTQLDPDTVRILAATKIQAAWRGYCFRRRQTTKASHRVLAGLARINETIRRNERIQSDARIHHLEQRLNQETAMRVAFEKAMEDMTVLMDHQHKVLHDRLEQEVDMRQTYEQKMESAMDRIQPMEARLRQEAKARVDMESMMSRVLDQLHELKAVAKQEKEEKVLMQKKLDDATAQIALLKKTPRASVREPVVRPPTVRAPTSASVREPIVRPPTVRSATSASVRTSSPASIRPASTRPTRTPKPSSKPTRPTTPSNIIRRTTTPHRPSSNSRAAEIKRPVSRKL